MSHKLIGALVVTASLVLVGCGEKDASNNSSDDTSAAGDSAHTPHGEVGPHEGLLIELGDSYHAEIVADHDSHTLTVYLLDGQVKKLQEIDATALTVSVFKDGEFVDYALNASDAPDAFSLDDIELCHMFDHDEDVKARIKATISGEEVVGKYDHEAHGDSEPHDDH